MRKPSKFALEFARSLCLGREAVLSKQLAETINERLGYEAVLASRKR